ncbi:hypothetical protein SAMN05446037_1006105 [Anaerovirgula multivorans]|uniref:Uncharacterized protein n=1 Tax=Anaerovirgula multivorans TaxID=312168 RepID=A0A239CQS8_9FIRM|nr:hypothetical protein [Anaerovirgula multivorans]SNS22525.1 hypothetical protein SAMN05446037_1006105 [Anaerovirgula multivorans]
MNRDELRYKYSQADLKKKCYNCKWLKMYNGSNGKCVCPHIRIRNRDRNLLSEACVYKFRIMAGVRKGK